MPSCLAVGIPAKGSTALTFDLPSGTTKIKGMVHLLSGSRVDAVYSAGGGEKILQDIVKSASFEIDASGDRFEISFSGDASRACIEAAALSE